MKLHVASKKNQGGLADTHEGDIWASHLYQPRGKRKHTYLAIQEMPNLTVAHVEPMTGEITWKTPEDNYVGQDGFVVPKNAEEFFARYPDYATAYAYKLMHRKVYGYKLDMEVFDEVASEFQLHLCHLPETQAAYKAGCRDRIETFNPVEAHGAKKGRFFHYLNEILAKKFSSYVYDGLLEEPSVVAVGVRDQSGDQEETPSGQYVTLPDTGVSFESELIQEMDAQTILTRVLGVVKEKDRPRVKEVLEAAMIYDKTGEIATHLNIDRKEVAKAIRKVRTAVARRGVLV